MAIEMVTISVVRTLASEFTSRLKPLGAPHAAHARRRHPRTLARVTPPDCGAGRLAGALARSDQSFAFIATASSRVRPASRRG